MAVRKNVHDPAARVAAAELIAHTDGLGLDTSEAGGLVGVFATAEFEIATVRIGGQSLDMRRVVLTGPWEPVK